MLPDGKIDSYRRFGGSPAAVEMIEHARQACVMHRVSFEGTDPHSVRVPMDAVEELVQCLSSTVQHKVQQIVPLSPSQPAGNLFSGMIWQQLAQRCHVERYYLVPSGDETELRASHLIDADKEHQLRSHPVTVTGWDRLSQIPMNTVWLIDDSVVVKQEFSGNGSASWLVSGRKSEIADAQRLMRAVLARLKATAASPRPAPEMTGWLLESAPMIRSAAQLSCTSSRYLGDGNCAWYHGAWQYLRLFDMVSSPNWHADFYASALRDAIHGRGARKVLISGTADYTTLAFVLDAAKSADGKIPKDLEVHVLDLCETPLGANRWYARRWGQRIMTHQADVTEQRDLAAAGLPVDGEFDLIVADAFLTRFARNESQKVLNSWFHLLRPGGAVLTTVRLHPGNDYRATDEFEIEWDSSRRVAAATDDFELRLRERAAGWRGMLTIDLDDLSGSARQYAQKMTSHDLGDARDVTTAFEDQEFEIVQHGAGRVPGELIGTEYLRVLARRPSRTAGAPQA
ncbi:class I SAM-dependent methyltransferase [Actinoplanes sp. HUAS TT8]|uniref:class I SAM-dependent methyltransferase n=1 Tax=Actinoplanes sp. HUAS TT8 TaxID=3447453 RepID=UPI003F51D559